jgi:hypothetical protein
MGFEENLDCLIQMFDVDKTEDYEFSALSYNKALDFVRTYQPTVKMQCSFTCGDCILTFGNNGKTLCISFCQLADQIYLVENTGSARILHYLHKIEYIKDFIVKAGFEDVLYDSD